MRILILHNDSIVSEKLSFSIRSQHNCEVILCEGLTEFDTYLSADNERPHLFIFTLDPATLADFKTFLQSAQTYVREAPILLSLSDVNDSEFQNLSSKVRIITKGQLIKKTQEAISALIKEGILKTDAPEELYFRISTQILVGVYPLKGDVYIRLSEKKYIKLRQSGDEFDEKDFERYTIGKKIDYLYIRKDDVAEFISKFTGQLEQSMNLSDPHLIDQVIEQGDKIFEVVKELGSKIGFDKDVQKIAKAQVEVSLKAIGKTPKLADLLKKHLAKGGNYLSSHGHLTASLACAIASHLEWGSQTTFQKLSMAAFFHDITLDTDETARVDRLTTEVRESLSLADLKKVQDHPQEAAEIVKQFHEIPPDVDTIIAQHHEKPDRGGFPRGLNYTHISPLACIFIIAHDLARFMLSDKRDPESFKKHIADMEELYNVGNFKKTYKALLENLGKV